MVPRTAVLYSYMPRVCTRWTGPVAGASVEPGLGGGPATGRGIRRGLEKLLPAQPARAPGEDDNSKDEAADHPAPHHLALTPPLPAAASPAFGHFRIVKILLGLLLLPAGARFTRTTSGRSGASGCIFGAAVLASRSRKGTSPPVWRFPISQSSLARNTLSSRHATRGKTALDLDLPDDGRVLRHGDLGPAKRTDHAGGGHGGREFDLAAAGAGRGRLATLSIPWEGGGKKRPDGAGDGMALQTKRARSQRQMPQRQQAVVGVFHVPGSSSAQCPWNPPSAFQRVSI